MTGSAANHLPAPSGSHRPLSIGGFPVGVAVGGAFEDAAGTAGSPVWAAARSRLCVAGPGREGLAEVAVVGVLGGDGQALPVGEPFGEGAVRGGQVLDPLAHLAGWLARGQGELGALGLGGGFGFGRAERRVVLAGVAAAEFGVGGDGQVALGAGGGVPVGAVGHDRGEDGLALPVGLVQGVVAGREFLLAGGGAVVAAAWRRLRLRRWRGGRPGGRRGRRRGPGGARRPTYCGAQAVSTG